MLEYAKNGRVDEEETRPSDNKAAPELRRTTSENWKKRDNHYIVCSQPREAGRPVDAMEG